MKVLFSSIMEGSWPMRSEGGKDGFSHKQRGDNRKGLHIKKTTNKKNSRCITNSSDGFRHSIRLFIGSLGCGGACIRGNSVATSSGLA